MNRFDSITTPPRWLMASLLIAFAAGCGGGSTNPGTNATGSGNDTFNYATSAEFIASGGAVVNAVDGGAGVDSVVINGPITMVANSDLSRATAVENLKSATDATALTHNIVINSYTRLSDFTTIDLSGSTNALSTSTVNLTGVVIPVGVTRYVTIIGTAGADSITSGNHNGTIIGGAGNDTLVGAAGTNTFIFGLTDGTDTINDASTADTLIQITSSGAALSSLNFLRSGNDIVIGFNGQQVTKTNQYLDAKIDSITFTGGATYGGYTLANTGYEVSSSLTALLPLNTIIAGTTGNESLLGIDGNDLLFGNAGVDTLNGGIGSDLLEGGAGVDTFVFNTALGATNIDTIVDFTVGTDVIHLDNVIFVSLTLGALNPANFIFSTTVPTDTTGDANTFIKYDSTTGALYYDSNGSAAGGTFLQFATLTGSPDTLDAGSFVVN